MSINWAPWFGLHIPGLNLLQVTFLSRDIQKGHESSGSWVEGQELPKKVEYELGGERQIKKLSRKGEGREKGTGEQWGAMFGGREKSPLCSCPGSAGQL